MGLGLCLPWSAPSKAQALDDILTAGVIPADAHSAPAEINMGYGITSALRVAAAETLMNDREFGFCFAMSEAKTDVKLGPSLQAQSQFFGGQMGISLHCDNPGKLPTVASPMRFSGTPLKHELPPPTVGQHTEEILRGVLKKSDAEIEKLRAGGAV